MGYIGCPIAGDLVGMQAVESELYLLASTQPAPSWGRPFSCASKNAATIVTFWNAVSTISDRLCSILQTEPPTLRIPPFGEGPTYAEDNGVIARTATP